MIFAKHALMPEGWVRDLRVTIVDGRITGLAPGASIRCCPRSAICIPIPSSGPWQG
jgi:hypothetical protein